MNKFEYLAKQVDTPKRVDSGRPQLGDLGNFTGEKPNFDYFLVAALSTLVAVCFIIYAVVSVVDLINLL